MKEKVIKHLIKDGYTKTIADALVCKYLEEAERHGCHTSYAVYKFIVKQWSTK